MRFLPIAALALLVGPLSAQDKSAQPGSDARKMLYNFHLAEAQKHFDARREVIAKLQSPEDIKKRQEYLREKFLEALGGFPEKTTLNAKVAGTIQRDRFRVEKVIYESRPQHYVTANFYLPEGKGPFPGVLVPCGHSANGKAAEPYQRACILMAQHGMAVLCYDPIGQGERVQLLDKMGKPAIAGSTSEHTMVGVGALLAGQSTATYRIWDGIRSLDYLASRPEVDPNRLGCTGNSGGGTLTSYLMALDDRIACAAPSCYLTTLERLFVTIGPQDAEQNITGQVAFGMEHTDFITMRAPRPTLMCVAIQDYFDIGGARTTFKEASSIYKKMGAGDKAAFFEFDDKHGFSKPRREAATRWMKRWLLGVDEPISEGDFPAFTDAELQCTRSGQVLEDFKGKSAFHLNAERARSFAKQRDMAAGDRQAWTAEVAKLIGLKPVPGWGLAEAADLSKAIYEGKPAPWHGLQATRAEFVTEPGIRVPIVFCRSADKDLRKIVLFLHEDGIDAGAEAVNKLVKFGHHVAVLELRGWGDSSPGKPGAKKAGFFGSDAKESFLALHINRPLLGQRVYDLLRVIDFFSGKVEQVFVHAVGNTGPAALHAAALSQRVESMTLERSLLSWMNVVENPVSVNQLSNAVPGALKMYDLPDLAATLAPAPLMIRNPVDGQLQAVSQRDLERAYTMCRERFARQNAADKLILQER